jgi:hypothetical protein
MNRVPKTEDASGSCRCAPVWRTIRIDQEGELGSMATRAKNTNNKNESLSGVTALRASKSRKRADPEHWTSVGSNVSISAIDTCAQQSSRSAWSEHRARSRNPGARAGSRRCANQELHRERIKINSNNRDFWNAWEENSTEQNTVQI